jgi:hypothetical protein
MKAQEYVSVGLELPANLPDVVSKVMVKAMQAFLKFIFMTD